MKYSVKGGVAEIGADMVLKLSADQLAARRHAVEEVKGGHRPTGILQFKAGETIDIVDVTLDKMPRTLSDVLEPVDGKRSSKSAKTGKGGQPAGGDAADAGAGNGAGADADTGDGSGDGA